MPANEFLNILEQERKKMSETVAMTIRVTEEDDIKIKDLMAMTGLSRQDLIYKALEQSVFAAWSDLTKRENNKPINIDSENSEKIFYMLNTNKVNDIDDHQFMLDNQVAAAFEDGYTTKIDNMVAGATVFLYESGKGIIAYGTADDEVLKKDHYGVPDKTHYRKLHNFVKLDDPLEAKKIKEILGRYVPFVATLIAIPDGGKILDKLQNK